MPEFDEETGEVLDSSNGGSNSIEGATAKGKDLVIATVEIGEGRSGQLSWQGMGPRPTFSSLVVPKVEINLSQGLRDGAVHFNYDDRVVVTQHLRIKDFHRLEIKDNEGFVLGHERKHIPDTPEFIGVRKLDDDE